MRETDHPLAFPAVLIGSCALAFGPWLVRLSGVGPVAAGFWRLALALPFLFVIAAMTRQPVHWPGRRLGRAVAIARSAERRCRFSRHAPPVYNAIAGL